MSSYRSKSIGRLSRLPQPTAPTNHSSTSKLIRSKSCSNRESTLPRVLQRANSNLGSQAVRPGSSGIKSTVKSTTSSRILVRTNSNLGTGSVGRISARNSTKTPICNVPQSSRSNLGCQSNAKNTSSLKTSTTKSGSHSSNNLRTPLQLFRGRSPTSLRKSQHGVQLFSVIKRYFQEKDPNLTELKPPTIANFITTMNILFQELDPSISFNKANYQQDVPNKLVQLGFAGKISAKFMRTVNSSISFQQVLDMWIFLFDLVEQTPTLLGVPEDELLLFDRASKFISKDYSLCFIVANAEHFSKEYEDDICDMLQVDFNDVMNKRKELNDRIVMHEEALKKNKMLKQVLQDREEAFETACNLDKTVQKYNEELHVIDTKLSTQKYSISDYNKLKNDKICQESIDKLVQEKATHLQSLLDETFSKINEYRIEFLKTIYKINNQMYGFTKLLPDYEDSEVRTSGFANPEFLNELQDVKTKYLEHNKKLLVKVDEEMETSKQLSVQIEAAEGELRVLMLQNEQKMRERQKFEDELSTVVGNQALKELKKILSSEDEKLNILLKEVVKIQAETIDLEHYYSLADKRLEEVCAFKSELRTKVEDLKETASVQVSKFMREILDLSNEMKSTHAEHEKNRLNRVKKIEKQIQENFNSILQLGQFNENIQLTCIKDI